MYDRLFLTIIFNCFFFQTNLFLLYRCCCICICGTIGNNFVAFCDCSPKLERICFYSVQIRLDMFDICSGTRSILWLAIHQCIELLHSTHISGTLVFCLGNIFPDYHLICIRYMCICLYALYISNMCCLESNCNLLILF